MQLSHCRLSIRGQRAAAASGPLLRAFPCAALQRSNRAATATAGGAPHASAAGRIGKRVSCGGRKLSCMNSKYMTAGTSEVSAEEPTFTVEEAIESVGMGKFQFQLLAYIGMLWFADAMELMLLSYIGPAVRSEFMLTPALESVLTSCVFIGMIIGSSFWGGLSDTRGRRPAFLYTAVFSALFAYLSAAAPTFWLLVVARTLLGIALAGGPVGDTLFLEYMPKDERGKWMMSLGVFWTMGGITEAALAWWLLSSFGWRVLLVASATPLALLLIFFPWFPESPRYLLVQGRNEEAMECLKRAARVNGKSLPLGRLVAHRGQLVAAPRAEALAGNFLQQLCQLADDMKQKVSDLFSPKLEGVTLLLLAPWLFSMMGYYGLVLLATEIHVAPVDASAVVDAATAATQGLTSEAFKSILITSISELPALAVAWAGMELLGRKATVIASLIGAAGTTLALTLNPTGTILTGILFMSRLSISVAFNTLLVFTKEIFPTSIRTLGLSVCNTVGRIGGFLAPILVINLAGSGNVHIAEMVLAGLCISAAVFIGLIKQETRGQELKDTEADELEEVQLTRPAVEGQQI